jgi:hypothetical protein
MKKRKQQPSLERLRAVLDYRPDTGKFFWKERTGYRNILGEEAGGLDSQGSVKISFDKETHSAHYLAWYYVHGEWPAKIQHRNGNKQDNRIDNLMVLHKDPITKRGSADALTHDRLLSIIDYNPETGAMVWRVSTNNRNTIGSEAGSIAKTGYRVVCIDYKQYLAHRLAWFYVHGSWPKEIDHINRDRSDNRMANLRLATRGQNNMNTGLRSDNKSGHTGITWHKGSNKWRATIHHNGKQIQVGMFDTIEEAAKAYSEAAAKLYGDFVKKPES